MKCVFKLLLKERAKPAKDFFEKVSFAREEFLHPSESINYAQNQLSEYGFAWMCKKYYDSVLGLKYDIGLIDVNEKFDFSAYRDQIFFLYGKENFNWEELDIFSEKDREEKRFQWIIEGLIEYYSIKWVSDLKKRFNTEDPFTTIELVEKNLLIPIKPLNSEIQEKSIKFFE